MGDLPGIQTSVFLWKEMWVYRALVWIYSFCWEFYTVEATIHNADCLHLVLKALIKCRESKPDQRHPSIQLSKHKIATCSFLKESWSPGGSGILWEHNKCRLNGFELKSAVSASPTSYTIQALTWSSRHTMSLAVCPSLKCLYYNISCGIRPPSMCLIYDFCRYGPIKGCKTCSVCSQFLMGIKWEKTEFLEKGICRHMEMHVDVLGVIRWCWKMPLGTVKILDCGIHSYIVDLSVLLSDILIFFCQMCQMCSNMDNLISCESLSQR